MTNNFVRNKHTQQCKSHNYYFFFFFKLTTTMMMMIIMADLLGVRVAKFKTKYLNNLLNKNFTASPQY